MKPDTRQRLKASTGTPEIDAHNHTTRKPTKRELEQAPEKWEEVQPANPGVHYKWNNIETQNSVILEGPGSVTGDRNTYAVIYHGSAGTETIHDEIATESQANKKAKSWMRRNPNDKTGNRGTNKYGNRF